MSLNSSLTRREFVRNSLFVAAAPALVRASSLMMIKPWKESSLWRVLGVTYGLGWQDCYATPYDASPLRARIKSLQFMRFSMPSGIGLSPGDVFEFDGGDTIGPMIRREIETNPRLTKDINDNPYQTETAKRLLG